MIEAIMRVLGEHKTGQDKSVTPLLLEPFGRRGAVAVPVGNAHRGGALCTHSLKKNKQESRH